MSIVQYNNQRLTLRDRVSAFLQGSTSGEKDMPLPMGMPINIMHSLPSAVWMGSGPANYFGEGYRLNSAVFAVTRTLAQAFSEPPLKCYTDETKKKPIPKHPLRMLIERPNEWMGEDEFWRLLVVYAASTGNAYGYIVPSNGGTPAELWPYSDLIMKPVSSRAKWIDHYEYSIDNGVTITKIDPSVVVHYKYAPDPFEPYKGMGALRPIAREVDSDNELTRYLKSLLQNDAVPRTIITVPAGSYTSPQQKVVIKETFKKLYGGDNRGEVGVFEGGAEPKRLALNLQELAFDALRGVPEARIASAYGVPAIMAGLNIGLARSTYSNYEEARKAFTEQTLVPMWKSVASEIQQSLVPMFGNDCFVDFDLTQVRALQEGTEVRLRWIIAMGAGGFLTKNEVRAEAGFDAIAGEDELPKPAAPPPPPVAPDPNATAPNTQPGPGSQDTNTGEPTVQAESGKGLSDAEIKGAKLTRAAIEKRIQGEMATRIKSMHDKAADRIEKGA